MPKQLRAVDITHTPDILRLAEEVATSGIPRVLKRDNKAVAVLSPVSSTTKPTKRYVKTKSDYEAFVASFGSWKDNVDVDGFLKDREESRRFTRPEVEL